LNSSNAKEHVLSHGAEHPDIQNAVKEKERISAAKKAGAAAAFESLVKVCTLSSLFSSQISCCRPVKLMDWKKSFFLRALLLLMESISRMVLILLDFSLRYVYFFLHNAIIVSFPNRSLSRCLFVVRFRSTMWTNPNSRDLFMLWTHAYCAPQKPYSGMLVLSFDILLLIMHIQDMWPLFYLNARRQCFDSLKIDLVNSSFNGFWLKDMDPKAPSPRYDVAATSDELKMFLEQS
jgi:hypothetical protein